MAATEARMRELGLVDPLSVLALDEWEIERQRFIIILLNFDIDIYYN